MFFLHVCNKGAKDLEGPRLVAGKLLTQNWWTYTLQAWQGEEKNRLEKLGLIGQRNICGSLLPRSWQREIPLLQNPLPPSHSLLLLKFSMDSIIAAKVQAANLFLIFAQRNQAEVIANHIQFNLVNWQLNILMEYLKAWWCAIFSVVIPSVNLGAFVLTRFPILLFWRSAWN